MEDQKPDKAALDKAIQDANNTKQGVDEQDIAESIRVKEEPGETDLDANSTIQSVDEHSLEQSKPSELITVKQEPQETDQRYWKQNGKDQRQSKYYVLSRNHHSQFSLLTMIYNWPSACPIST